MKTFYSENYLKRIAQQMVDWDNPGQTENVFDNFDEVPEEDNKQEVDNIKEEATNFDKDLPTITPDEASTIYSEDELEQVGETPISAKEEKAPKKSQEEFPQFSSPFQAFRWAKHNKQVIRIYYVTVHGTFIIRDVEPHGDFWARTTSKRILVTWDETVGNIRAFRVENVQKYEFMGEEFIPKFNFSLRQRNYRRKLRNKKNRNKA